MPFCPECKYEYVSGIATCPDCGRKLVAKLPEDRGRNEVDMVCIGEFTVALDADMAKIRLDLASIESFIFNNTPVRAQNIPANLWVPVRLLVHREDAERALEILASKD